MPRIEDQLQTAWQYLQSGHMAAAVEILEAILKRTPSQPYALCMLGMAQLLEGTQLAPEQRQYVQSIRASGEHLLPAGSASSSSSDARASGPTARQWPSERPAAALAAGAAAEYQVVCYCPSLNVAIAGTGGNVAANASGSRSFRYGATRRHVKALRKGTRAR